MRQQQTPQDFLSDFRSRTAAIIVTVFDLFVLDGFRRFAPWASYHQAEEAPVVEEAHDVRLRSVAPHGAQNNASVHYFARNMTLRPAAAAPMSCSGPF